MANAHPRSIVAATSRRIPNLRHLHALHLVESLGSVKAAADGVHLSQSAVTQAVLHLERDLGTALYERTGEGMRATEAGRKLVRRIRRAFTRLETLAREVDGAGGRREPAHQLFTATQLRAFVAVVRAGGYSLAARDLDMSQPSVFRAAKDFENLFAEPLFRRTAGGIEPTRAAVQLARQANLALTEIRQGFFEVAELRGSGGSEVVVGCLPLARSGLVPDTITSLLGEFPDARVRIVDGPYHELLHGLLDGAIDLIVGALREPKPAGHLSQQHLFDDTLSIIVRAGHPWLGAAGLAAYDFARLEWIVPRKGTPARAHFERYFGEQDIAVPAHIVESSSLIATRGLLLTSDRAAILSARQVALELDYGILADLSGPLPGTARSIGLTTRDGWRPTVLQQSFIDELRRQVHGAAAIGTERFAQE